MRPLLILFFFIAISTDSVVEGMKCPKSSFGWWTCGPCGKGMRCLACRWCTGAYCHPNQNQTTRSTTGVEYGSVEALYKVPFLDVFNDIKELLEVEELSDAAVVDIYKEASDEIKEECAISNNSPDLNNLSIFIDKV